MLRNRLVAKSAGITRGSQFATVRDRTSGADPGGSDRSSGTDPVLTQHRARQETRRDFRPIRSASGGSEGGDRPDHVSSGMSSHSSSETIHSRIAELRGRHQPIGRFLPSEIQRRERGRSGSVTEDRQQPHNRIPGSETGRQATGGRNLDTRSGGSGTNGATAQTPSRSRRTRRSSPATKRLGVRC
jgi:hypothetical protein